MTRTEKVPAPIEATSLSGELLKYFHAATAVDKRRKLRLLLVEALRLERLEIQAEIAAIDAATAAESKSSKSQSNGAQAANFGGYLHRAILSVSKI